MHHRTAPPIDRTRCSPIKRHVVRLFQMFLATAVVVPQTIAQQVVSDAATVPRPHDIPRIETRITIDGVLDDPEWRSAWSMSLDYEVHPGENTPAPVHTVVFVTHDRSRLYVGFRADDPDPRAIRAHLTDRDQAWNDDWVGVVLDTFNDERRDYLFVVNPLGVQMDVIEVESTGETPWDGIWRSAAAITASGWTAELEIPFSTLRFQRNEGAQIWGFDAIRGYPRNVSHQMGAFPRDRSNNCYLCQALKIKGFAAVSPGRNIEIVPTLTASRTDVREDLPSGPMIPGDPEAEFGFTVRWGLTPNLTVSTTYNPDFSQIEADALQLQVNRPFAIFYPEKRPFFMEGADFFDTSLDIVYTRMIREPAWGLKLTGKEGRHTVGAYVVDDEITNLIIPGSQGSGFTVLDQESTAAVLRYKRDFGNRVTLGGIFTNRSGADYFNRVAGIDGDLRLTARDRVSIQVLGSATRYPADVAEDFHQPSGVFGDWATEVVYVHDTRTWEWWAVFADIGGEFRADLGFMPQVDYQHREAGLGYQWNATDRSWYSRLDLKAKVADTMDQSGFLLFHEDVIQFTAEGPLQSHSVLRPSRVREGFNGREFDFNRFYLHLCGKPNGHSHAWFNFNGGGKIDYAKTRLGVFGNLDLGFWYHVGRHLYVEPSYTRERMEVDDGWLYTSSIGQITTSWQFNARCFVRAILQHVDNRFAVDLFNDGRRAELQRLLTQLLFSYKVNPRTVLFVGYSEQSLAEEGHPLARADRTLFAKIGYAWVF